MNRIVHAARHLAVIGAVLALLTGASLLSASESRYRILVEQTEVGEMRVRALSRSERESSYRHDENGRATKTYERFSIDPGGVPIRYETHGDSGYGTTVDESFELTLDRARWRSRVDEGDMAREPGSLFVPMEASPAYMAQLARTVLDDPENTSSLVAGGRLQVDSLERRTVKGPSGPIEIELVELTGLDPQSTHLWLRDHPDSPLFASTYPRQRIILRGYEHTIPELLERQNRAIDRQMVRLKDDLEHPLPGSTLIREVRWFNAREGRLEGPSDIWLIDGRIARISLPRTTNAKADQRIDGRGLTLLPGLFDTHVHYAPDRGLIYLAAGITSVRDMGNQNERLIRLRDMTDRGELPGPRIIPAGFIEGASRFASRNGFVVRDLDRALEAVRWYADRGYRMVKLYSSVRPEWVEPITQAARQRGMRVTGHVPAFMSAERAIQAGFDEISHINQLMLNFVSRPGDDTRTLQRFTRVGEDAHRVDLSSERARALLQLMKERGTAVEPTLVAFEAMFTQKQGQSNPSWIAIADHLPILWRRSLKVAELDLDGEQLQNFRKSFRRLLDLSAAVQGQGIPLIAGTDSGSGLALIRELELMVQAGLTPAQALQTATWNAAQALGEAGQRGAIEIGQRADLILVNGDPLSRVSDLRKIALVIQGTSAWRPSELWQRMGFKPFTAPAAIDGPEVDD
jgi:hypothetical protein